MGVVRWHQVVGMQFPESITFQLFEHDYLRWDISRFHSRNKYFRQEEKLNNINKNFLKPFERKVLKRGRQRNNFVTEQTISFNFVFIIDKRLTYRGGLAHMPGTRAAAAASTATTRCRSPDMKNIPELFN